MVEYKDYLIVSDGSFGMFYIQQKGSGALPDALKGSFTRKSYAMFAIDNYIPKRGAKGYAKTKRTADL
jgi:hypothetical protein